MQTAADSAGAQAQSADEYMIVTASSGAGHTVIEGLRPSDGLTLWYYDTEQELGDFAAGDGVVYLSTWASSGGQGGEGARVAALRASDGNVLWRRGPEDIRRQTRNLQQRAWMITFLNTGGPIQAWRGAMTHRLAGYARLSAGDGLVCACTYSDAFAFSAHEGTLRWTYPSAFGMDIQFTTVRAG